MILFSNNTIGNTVILFIIIVRIELKLLNMLILIIIKLIIELLLILVHVLIRRGCLLLELVQIFNSFLLIVKYYFYCDLDWID